MNIAVLNWRDQENPAAGGAELFVHEVGRRWVEQGHTVTLVTSRYKGGARRSSSGGIEIRRVGNLGNGSHHFLAGGALRELGPVDLLLESVSTIPYWTPLRRTNAAKVVTLVHQLAGDVWESHLRWPLAARAARGIEPKLYLPYRSSRAGTLAAVSGSTAEDLRTIGLEHVTVVPQGGIGVQPLCEKENRPTIMFVGRLAANKRPDHALAAFKLIRRHVPDSQMWVVGEGSMKRALTARGNEAVTFFPRLPRDELLERMGRAHLLLVPSVREGWGLVVTEANAMGTPVVAYDVHGLRDSIKHGETGLLVEQDPMKLGDGALRLLEDQQSYERLRDGAIQWGRSFTWDRTARELLELTKGSAQTFAESAPNEIGRL